jgi:hypothetical protein
LEATLIGKDFDRSTIKEIEITIFREIVGGI